MAIINHIMQQAYNLYLQSVTDSSYRSAGYSEPIAAETALDDKIETLKEALEQLPDHEPGTHVLVWALFLFAATSSVKKYREFFYTALLK